MVVTIRYSMEGGDYIGGSMDGRVCVGFSRDCGDLVRCSTGSIACVRHSMEGRDLVEAQWVIVHSRDAGTI